MIPDCPASRGARIVKIYRMRRCHWRKALQVQNLNFATVFYLIVFPVRFGRVSLPTESRAGRLSPSMTAQGHTARSNLKL